MRNIRIQSLMVVNLSCVAQTGLESMLPIATPQNLFQQTASTDSRNIRISGEGAADGANLVGIAIGVIVMSKSVTQRYRLEGAFSLIVTRFESYLVTWNAMT